MSNYSLDSLKGFDNLVVVDTNVLIGTGVETFNHYHNTLFILPLSVIDELEEHLGDKLGAGQMCRSVLKRIEDARVNTPGVNVTKESIPFGEDNGLLIHNHCCVTAEERKHRGGSCHVIAAAKEMAALSKDISVTVLSNKTSTRLQFGDFSNIKATAFGAEMYLTFTGWINLTESDLGKDYQTDSTDELLATLSCEALMEAVEAYCHQHGHAVPYCAGVVIADDAGVTKHLLKKVGREFTALNGNINAKNFRPREGNLEQTLAMEYLLDPRIQIITLGGIAGSGKSFLSLATGFAQLHSIPGKTAQQFDQISVYRSIVEVADQAMGFLPGDIAEKMAPWAKPVWANVEQIDKILNRGPDKKAKGPGGAPITTVDWHAEQDDITVEPVTYIRGITLMNKFVIVDDAQSLEWSTLLDIISRLGRGSKIVFTYDMSQNDNRYISTGNSILNVVNKLLSWKNYAHISFTKSERSELAQKAGDLLQNGF